MWTPVTVESPYAGDIDANTTYARRAYHDCLVNRGEAPFASHLNYTQPGVLDDTVPEERKAGIEAGLAIGKLMSCSVFYVDRGFSSGMVWGLRAALEAGRPIAFRMFGNRSASYDVSADEVKVRYPEVASAYKDN